MKAHHYFFLGLAVATIATALLGATFFNPPYRYQGSLIEPAVPVREIALTDQYGRPFRLSELLDSDQDVRAVLVFFGYTYCPDVCPMTLIEFKQIKERLGDQADRLRFIFITVDPERDTPEQLRRHLENYDPTFIGLSGTQEELEPVWNRFWVYRAVQPPGPSGGYLVDHPARIYVIDRNGDLGLTFGFGSGADLMAQDLRQMVR